VKPQEAVLDNSTARAAGLAVHIALISFHHPPPELKRNETNVTK
jgi:hypothetical protein